MIVTQDMELLESIYDFDAFKTASGKDFVEKIRSAVINKNTNMIVTIVGKPGSGKSWACLRLAEVLSDACTGQPFSIDHVAFDKRKFYDLINSDLPKGQVIVYEEVGVNESNRRWQKNMTTNDIMQTFRHRNLILLMNTPLKSFVDKQARQLNHAVFWMKRIDHEKNQSFMKPYFTDTNPITGLTFTSFTVLKGDLITEIKLNKPSIELIREYEKGKVKFTKALNQRSLASYAREEKKQLIEHRKEQKQARAMGIDISEFEKVED